MLNVHLFVFRIKSKCCVEFSNSDQASETRMALDGVTWPAINPKTLRVAFSSKVCSSNFSYPSGFCLLLVEFSLLQATISHHLSPRRR